jgi:hypothetical protein
MEIASKHVASKAYERKPPTKTIYLGLRIPRETYDALVKLQKKDENGVSLSFIVRSILRQYVRNNGKARR